MTDIDLEKLRQLAEAAIKEEEENKNKPMAQCYFGHYVAFQHALEPADFLALLNSLSALSAEAGKRREENKRLRNALQSIIALDSAAKSRYATEDTAALWAAIDIAQTAIEGEGTK